MQRPFRFVHSSDFHLHQPPHGLAEAPDHLIAPLVECAYRAATAVFDAAIEEQADFILLAGHLLAPDHTGPRGLAFLKDQFARAERHGIKIYWAAAPIDGRLDWPGVLTWPENVHVFPSQHFERITHKRQGEPLCDIDGCSVDRFDHFSEQAERAMPTTLRGHDLQHEPFTIALLPQEIAAPEPNLTAVRYWALGGKPTTATPLSLSDPPRVAHFAGSPQGRTPDECGPHGCTVVHVDEHGRIRLTARPTDAIRFHHERLDVSPTSERADLEHRLRERMNTMIAAAADRVHLVRWTIGGDAAHVCHGHPSHLAGELLDMLRHEFGFRHPAAWSISVEFEPSEIPAEWLAQETLLGDFLRTVRQHETMDAEPLDLAPYVPERHLAGGESNRLPHFARRPRPAVLRQAAWLGAELLQPEDGREGLSR